MLQNQMLKLKDQVVSLHSAMHSQREARVFTWSIKLLYINNCKLWLSCFAVFVQVQQENALDELASIRTQFAKAQHHQTSLRKYMTEFETLKTALLKERDQIRQRQQVLMIDILIKGA